MAADYVMDLKSGDFGVEVICKNDSGDTRTVFVGHARDVNHAATAAERFLVDFLGDSSYVMDDWNAS